MRVECPSEGCFKSYKRKGNLSGHLLAKHSGTYKTLEETVAIVEGLFQKQFSRALKAKVEDNISLLPQSSCSYVLYEEYLGLQEDDPDFLEEDDEISATPKIHVVNPSFEPAMFEQVGTFLPSVS